MNTKMNHTPTLHEGTNHRTRILDLSNLLTAPERTETLRQQAECLTIPKGMGLHREVVGMTTGTFQT